MLVEALGVFYGSVDSAYITPLHHSHWHNEAYLNVPDLEELFQTPLCNC